MSTYDTSQAAYLADVVPPPVRPNTLAIPRQLASAQLLGKLIAVPSYNSGANVPVVIVPPAPAIQTVEIENVGSQSVFLSSALTTQPDTSTGYLGKRLTVGETIQWSTLQAIYAVCIGRVNNVFTLGVLDAGDPGGLVIVSIL